MARATFVKAAQKDIYKIGRRVEYVSKKGKREGQTLSKVDKTIPHEDGDEIFIKKGESYYHWALHMGPKQYSKEAPRQSQLTGSAFLSQIYSIQERMEDFSADEVSEVEEFRDELVSELQEMLDECQEKLDNMPESLQSAPSGETLQSRIDGLESMVSELESLSFDEIDEFVYDEEEEGDEEEQQEAWDEGKQEKIQEYIEEIQNISYDGE